MRTAALQDLAGIFQSEPGSQGARIVKSSRNPGPSEIVLSLHAEYEPLEVAQPLLRAQPAEVAITQIRHRSALAVVTLLLVYKIFLLINKIFQEYNISM